MKFECFKSKIEPVVQKLSKLTGRHLTLPVLSCVYLNASGDELKIKATNLEVGLETKIKIKGLKEGVLAVPASILLGILSSIKEENLTFEAKENNLKISSNKNSAIIKCLPHEDFPSIPRLKTSNTIKINSQNLLLGLKSVWYSASTSNIKPELASVYIHQTENGLVFVSTDSFRLAEKKMNIKTEIDFPDTLIPQNNTGEILRLFEDYSGEIEIIFEKNQAAFITKDFYLVSRLIDGSFPDYKQIIPKSFSTTTSVLKVDLLNAIKASSIFSDAINQVKLMVDVKNKTLNIGAKNNDVGEYNESLKISASGENIELNFNGRYVSDCLQSIAADSLALSFGGVGKPLVIEGATDKSFLYLVMPMNR